MRSLAKVLEDAAARAAKQVVLESGQPIVITTARGPLPGTEVIARTDLFDMIVAAVDDAQQIELAVGNPVEFMVEADGTWRVYAEPGLDGITVRAEREGEVPSLEIELDDTSGASGFAAADLPDDDDDAFSVDFSPSFSAADPAPGPAPGSERRAPSRPSLLDVGALDVPSVQPVDADFVMPPATPAAPHESGTWRLADDEDEFDADFAELGDDGAAPQRSEAHAPVAGVEQALGIPEDDDDDDDPFDPFAESGSPADSASRARKLPPTLPAVEARPSPPPQAAPPPAEATVGAAPPPPPPVTSPPSPAAVASTPTRREISVAPGASQAATRRELPVVPPEADTHRELPQAGPDAGALTELAASIGDGALVYVLDHGLAEALVAAFAAPWVTIDDGVELTEAWAQVRSMPRGGLVVVRREDPSTALPGLLRRLEEGYRVFVETRARTAAGARRVLLGVGASERAEAWLDEQHAFVVEPGEGGPRLRRLA